MSDDAKHYIRWFDHQREPREPPNPAYPNGIDLKSPVGGPCCTVALPYPAKRCGVYIVTCAQCHTRIAITTAGRPDDPRSVEIPCKPSRVH